ncbi:MAG: DUF3750 domain-containing protein [Alphaproteobacteria bacterium]|nr:DUF3750 domain-containing protein [Alphaproteobacteria bacterium]
MRRALIWSWRIVLFAILLPILVGGVRAYSRGWPDSWRGADWSSSGLLPAAAQVSEAKVIILAARTGRWKSIFAEHTSIVLKAKGASDWTRYDVVGWGQPVRRNAYAADAFWYGNKPYVVAEVTGSAAERMIPLVERSIAAYPHRERGTYTVWPGPNSNTFVAWVARNTEGLDVELPPVAVGKDYLGSGVRLSQAASGTGLVVSAWGLVGLTAALREGVEINLLGATIGIDPDDLAVKLPSLGKLSLLDIAS